jgi:hypothetical protein
MVCYGLNGTDIGTLVPLQIQFHDRRWTSWSHPPQVNKEDNELPLHLGDF